MGWRTDWLYGLVFQRVVEVWKQARKEANNSPGGPGTLPDFLRIQQCQSADLKNATCLSPVVREWTYRGTEFEPRAATPGESADDPAIIWGMFYTSGLVRFHITPDRKKVVFNCILGPLYGRGYVLRVWGQGKRSGFAPDPEATGWAS